MAGRYHADGSTALTDPENSVYIGANARGYNNSDDNSIVIGYAAIGAGANTAVLGNSSITNTYFGSSTGASAIHASAIYGYGFISANTGTATPLVANSGTVYTNTGDGDGSIITLPNDPVAGTVIHVAVTVAQTITINPSAGESVYLNGVQCSGTPAASSTIGSFATFRAVVGGSGGIWVATATGTWACGA
jgi:hypothetical protein